MMFAWGKNNCRVSFIFLSFVLYNLYNQLGENEWVNGLSIVINHQA